MQFLEINCYFLEYLYCFHLGKHQSTEGSQPINCEQRVHKGQMGWYWGWHLCTQYHHPDRGKTGNRSSQPSVWRSPTFTFPAPFYKHEEIWSYGNHAQDLYITDAAPDGTTYKTGYHHFHLPVVLRLAIIAVGLRKTKLGRPYC